MTTTQTSIVRIYLLKKSNKQGTFIVIGVLALLLSLYSVTKKNEKLTTTTPVKVALLDSGIINNQTLALSFDFINNKDEALDDFGHGTNLANLLLENEHVALYNAKVLNEHGSGQVDDVMAGLNWAYDNKVDVINMSFDFTANYPKLKETIDFITDKNIIIVSAVGNDILVYLKENYSDIK